MCIRDRNINNVEANDLLNEILENQKKRVVSPFIVLDVFSSDYKGKGLYDPGANVSTVLLSTLKKLEKKIFL